LIFSAAFRPVGLLELAIFQDHPVDALSTVDTLPRPEVFCLMKDLFVDHHAAATAAF